MNKYTLLLHIRYGGLEMVILFGVSRPLKYLDVVQGCKSICFAKLRFEKAKKQGETDPTYSIAGYCTLYSYYAYPDLIRPRIR